MMTIGWLQRRHQERALKDIIKILGPEMCDCIECSQAPGMQHGHAGAGSRAGRAAVRAAGCHDAGVARHLSDTGEIAIELYDGDALDAGILRMDDLQLGARGKAGSAMDSSTDPLTCPRPIGSSR